MCFVFPMFNISLLLLHHFIIEHRLFSRCANPSLMVFDYVYTTVSSAYIYYFAHITVYNIKI